MSVRLEDKYKKEVAPALHKEFGLSNVHQIPRVEKVVINVGAGRATSDAKLLEVATNTLRKITGQQPVQTKAKSSIASFKLREGQAIGLKVTLRSVRMYEFLDRLISIVLPRSRDFRGLSLRAFDPMGNYSIGLNDQSIFPELPYEDTAYTHGLQINIVTTTRDKDQSRRLLQLLGMPLERAVSTKPTPSDKGPKVALGAGAKTGGQNG